MVIRGKIFLFALLFSSFAFWQCATDRKVVYSVKEIKWSYNTNKSWEMKKLERVILNQNRELGSYSLTLIGRYLTFLNQKVEDKLIEDEKKYLNDIADFLVMVYEEKQDFNMKNLIILNLYHNFIHNERELLAILKANLVNFTSTNDEVVNYSLFIASELYRKNQITETDLAEQCLFLVTKVISSEAFLSALNCYYNSPAFSKAVLENVVLNDLYKKIVLKRFFIDQKL